MKRAIFAAFVLGLLLAAPQEKLVAMSAAEELLTGTVVETMNSGGYTYMLLEKNGKKTWAAAPKMKVEKGQEVSLLPGTEMEDFKSGTLKRTFDRIIFSAGPAPKHEAAGEKSSTTGSKDKVVNAPEKVEVEKAAGPNAYTVAEIYRDAENLDKKEVVVRGKIMKVSAAIMGKTWVHLQDGSGEREKGTHDLVVTTQDQPKVGEVVTFSGTIYKDKDFGSGYKYKTIMENASVKK